MAIFTYVAIDGKGKQVKGSLDADNQMKASDQLKKDGLTIIELKEGSALNKEVSLGSFGKKKVKGHKKASALLNEKTEAQRLI